MKDAIFNFCVRILMDISHASGISYEAINIWLFIIIHPLITILFVILYIITLKRFRNLKKRRIPACFTGKY